MAVGFEMRTFWSWLCCTHPNYFGWNYDTKDEAMKMVRQHRHDFRLTNSACEIVVEERQIPMYASQQPAEYLCRM